jgi:hypothetical protein
MTGWNCCTTAAADVAVIACDKREAFARKGALATTCPPKLKSKGGLIACACNDEAEQRHHALAANS